VGTSSLPGKRVDKDLGPTKLKLTKLVTKIDQTRNYSGALAACLVEPVV